MLAFLEGNDEFLSDHTDNGVSYISVCSNYGSKCTIIEDIDAWDRRTYEQQGCHLYWYKKCKNNAGWRSVGRGLGMAYNGAAGLLKHGYIAQWLPPAIVQPQPSR